MAINKDLQGNFQLNSVKGKIKYDAGIIVPEDLDVIHLTYFSKMMSCMMNVTVLAYEVYVIDLSLIGCSRQIFLRCSRGDYNALGHNYFMVLEAHGEDAVSPDPLLYKVTMSVFFATRPTSAQFFEEQVRGYKLFRNKLCRKIVPLLKFSP